MLKNFSTILGEKILSTIKEARQKLGLTQKQMADLIGTVQHRISEIERGIDGRKETKQMQHHLAAIELIWEYGLIEELTAQHDKD